LAVVEPVTSVDGNRRVSPLSFQSVQKRYHPSSDHFENCHASVYPLNKVLQYPEEGLATLLYEHFSDR